MDDVDEAIEVILELDLSTKGGRMISISSSLSIVDFLISLLLTGGGESSTRMRLLDLDRSIIGVFMM